MSEKTKERYEAFMEGCPTRQCTVSSWAKVHGISKRQAVRDLMQLDDAGVLDAEQLEYAVGAKFQWWFTLYWHGGE